MPASRTLGSCLFLVLALWAAGSLLPAEEESGPFTRVTLHIDGMI